MHCSRVSTSITSLIGRPHFASPTAYVRHLARIREIDPCGSRPWPPRNLAELEAAFDAYPDICRAEGWLTASALQAVGAPADFGRDPEPLSIDEQRRLVATIATDDRFRDALRGAIGV